MLIKKRRLGVPYYYKQALVDSVYKCVESIYEIPKLKFITYSKANGKQVHQGIGELRYIQLEFQYGKDGFQTTTIQFGGVKNRPSIRE